MLIATTMAEETKLTKKERKALQFRKTKEEREEDKEEKKRAREEEANKPKSEPEPEPEPVKKKRKTRRGKKGKSVNNGEGPRFIVFVGNLLYKVTEEELKQHFKSSKPDRVRIRKDKGIAFLEFDNETKDIQKKMDLALSKHHSLLNERKINVELTAGGGGNSDARKNKLKEKNDKLTEERRKKLVKALKEKNSTSETTEAKPTVHPARAALMNN